MAADPSRAFALVLRAFGSEARGHLLARLPPVLREAVLTHLEAEAPPPTAWNIVEQILAHDAARLFDDGTRIPDERLVEATPLQVSDLVTLLFLHNSPQWAAGVLPHLPIELQNEIIRKLCEQSWEVLERHVGRDEADFVRAFDEVLGAPARRTDPDFAVSTLADLASSLHVRRILTALYRVDSGAANEIREKLYSVADLDRLTDPELQTVLTGIDDWDLATAMTGFPRRLRGRVLSNVSERRARLLAEDERYLSDTDDEELILAYQRTIVERARSLFESGKIHTYLGSIAPSDDEDVPPQEEAPSRQADRVKPSLTAEVPDRPSRLRLIVIGSAAVLFTATLAGWFAAGGARRSGTGHGRGVSVEDYASRTGSGVEGAARAGGSGSGAPLVSGRVGATRGDVFVHSDGDTLVFAGGDLAPGQELVTGQDGEAVLTIRGDDARAHVGSESAVRFEEVIENEPSMHIRLGRVWIRVEDPRVEVRSPVLSVTGARGSLYEIRVVLSAATTVRVKEGTAWVTARYGDEEDRRVVAAGRYVRVDSRLGIDAGPAEESPGPSWLGLF